MDGTILRDSI